MPNFDNFNKLIDNKYLIAIVGPTSSGKSKLAMDFTETINSSIISADSRQIYKYLDIGTAKPNKEDLKKTEHFLIDIVEPDEYYSAGKFEEDADSVYSEIKSKNKIPILVGGSGLYINAMINGIFDEDKIFDNLDKNKINESIKPIMIGKSNSKNDILNSKRNIIKNQLIKRYETYGIYDLYLELEEVDMKSAVKYNDKNPVRVIRALEFYMLFGQPISSFQQENEVQKYEPIYFQVDLNREQLYNNINNRTLKMLEIGWIEETLNVLKMGYDPKINSLNTVGYKEIIDYLDEDNPNYKNYDFLIDKIQQKTRNYAKRQITWFNKYSKNCIFVNNINQIVDYLNKL